MLPRQTSALVAAAILLAFGGVPLLAAERLEAFADYIARHPLPPVQDYTLLGTELADDKPIVRFPGEIYLWFNPADHVPWLNESIAAGAFELELVDGYLPAVKYQWQRPNSPQSCEMIAFAADAESPGAIWLYVRLTETAPEGTRIQHFRLRDLAPIGAVEFDAALAALRARWESFFDKGRQFPGADPLLLNAAKASLVRALITFRGKHPRYGVGGYAERIHDGFPPTTIALVNCLLDWGHPGLAADHLRYYFRRFVTATGRIDYYGPSLAEYGQLLELVRRVDDLAPDRAWLTEVRPKVERLRTWLWQAIENSSSALIAGVPEADTRGEVDVYFHNNAWCWRGLRDIATVLGTPDEPRCEEFRQRILAAIAGVTDHSTSPPFIPPVARRVTPWESMTQDTFASYTNYRYWLELLSSGVLPHAEASAIIHYRRQHQGEAAAMTRFMQHADNWPITEYGLALLSWGELGAARDVLFGHLAGHTTPNTWTAYEQVSLGTESARRAIADYCVPSQLVGPRLLAAWLASMAPETRMTVPILTGPITLDGRLGEPCYRTVPPVELTRVAGNRRQVAPPTRAWLQWEPERLCFAFDVSDPEVVSAPASTDEHGVDDQDRVELFLWNGVEESAYGCIEISASGAVHDYQARLYRQFDDSWSGAARPSPVHRHAGGYTVEGAIPRSVLEALGLRLEPGARWRVGLFRADFIPARAERPVWITWVDAGGPNPDFHLPASFGEVELAPR
jgi:hypothetical protein